MLPALERCRTSVWQLFEALLPAFKATGPQFAGRGFRPFRYLVATVPDAGSIGDTATVPAAAGTGFGQGADGCTPAVIPAPPRRGQG